MKKHFYRFKEDGMHGLESCDVLTEDFVNKWGQKDEMSLRLWNKGCLTKMESTEEVHEVVETAEIIISSMEDRLYTLEVAMRAILTGNTRDTRFKDKPVHEVAAEALSLSLSWEIKD